MSHLSFFSYKYKRQWLNIDPSSPNEAANDNDWSNQRPIDNMYEQPPAYYNNGGGPLQGPGGPSGPHPVPYPAANVNNNIPPPHDYRRYQGYNGGNGNSYHGYSRHENYNALLPNPAMNGPGGYGGGNGNSIPFYR